MHMFPRRLSGIYIMVVVTILDGNYKYDYI